MLNGILGGAGTKMVSSLIGGVDLGKIMGGSEEKEDCLFLDVVVPGKAIRGEAKLPVLNWIYGGAYILGSKDGLYDGSPLVRASQENIIYVAGNYRLGSLGFMSGSSLEKEESVVTNAGFYDQRAVMEWIQKHIVSVCDYELRETDRSSICSVVIRKK